MITISKACFSKSNRLAVVLFCAFAINGCTGSSESGSNEPQPDSEITAENINPITSMTTRVDFDITVPAYSSDSLRVIMKWGDVQEAATWVSDEYWTLSVDLPLDMENALAVTFYDRDGAVTLASYESTFRTGFNSTDSYQIYADQFDSTKWDSDSDGISNLDESILGGDSVDLELRDAYFNAPYLFDFGTGRYENRVPADRPYYEFLEVIPDNEPPVLGDKTQTLTIDISETGNGTLDEYMIRHGGASGDYQITTNSATRTNTGDSVIWEGESTYNSQGEVLTTNVSSFEFTIVNAQTRRADGTYTSSNTGSFVPRIGLYVYALVGESSIESSACEPSSGSLMHADYLGRRDGELLFRWKVNRISKGVEEYLWTVVETIVETEVNVPATRENPDPLAVLADNLDDFEDIYLVRTLGATFYCDYPEFD